MVKYLKPMLKTVREDLASEGSDDQEAMARYWLDHQDQVTLDYQSKLVLNLHDVKASALDISNDGVVTNKAMGFTQCFLHGNGDGKGTAIQMAHDVEANHSLVLSKTQAAGSFLQKKMEATHVALPAPESSRGLGLKRSSPRSRPAAWRHMITRPAYGSELPRMRCEPCALCSTWLIRGTYSYMGGIPSILARLLRIS